jgi:D-glycero-D-manno-heptose 1,7-bisphosphate phosphatase
MNSTSRNRAVFLDRDGVLNNAVIRNGKPYPPNGLHEVHIMPGVREGLAALKAAGYLLIAVTNQPDVARGRVTRASVEEINQCLMDELPLDDFKTCYHDNADNCDCRKPKPGNILKSAEEYQIDLKKSFMIGDRWSDVEAGRRAGCRTIHLDSGYVEMAPEKPDFNAGNFTRAVEFILQSGQQDA